MVPKSRAGVVYSGDRRLNPRHPLELSFHLLEQPLQRCWPAHHLQHVWWQHTANLCHVLLHVSSAASSLHHVLRNLHALHCRCEHLCEPLVLF